MAPNYTGLNSLKVADLKAMIADKTYGAAGAANILRESIQRGDTKPEDFRLAHLFEAFVPNANELRLEFMSGGLSDGTIAKLREAGEVRNSEFQNITGQIVYSKTLQYYADEDFVFTKEVQEIPSPIQDVEKIAGVSRLGNDVGVVGEGENFPDAGPVEDFIHIPAGVKRGEKVTVSWEAVFNDRTGDLLKRCQEVGYFYGYDKEARIIDSIVDEGTGAKSILAGGHRYYWRNTSYATHQTSTPWDNVTASNALVDWTDVEGAELTLSRIVDPNTGLVTLIQPDVVAVTKQLEYTARYVLQATSLQVNAGGYATSGTVTRMELANFLPKYRILTSRLLETRMATDTDWYLGNFKQAFGYKVNRPMKVDPMPPNSLLEWTNEVVAGWKVSEVGAACVTDPRMVNESRA